MEILRKISSFVNNILQATVDIPYHHCGYLYVQTAFEKEEIEPSLISAITIPSATDKSPLEGNHAV